MSNDIDVEKLALEKFGTILVNGKEILDADTKGIKEICIAYHKAMCEQAEPVGFTITGKLGDRCSFKSTTVKKGDKVYTAPQDQSAEIERLKAREKRVLFELKEALKRPVDGMYVYQINKFAFEKIIKEIEAENENDD